MRKIIFLFIFLSSGIFAAAQFPAKKVLIEVATGTWCSSCPTAVQLIDKLQEEGYAIAVVKYHNNDPYENEASIYRNTFYDIQFFPTIHVDGTQLSPWNSYQQLESLYQDGIERERGFRIELTSEWVGADSVRIRAVITKNSGVASGLHRFFLAVTESNIPDEWHGQSEVNYAERLLLPDKEGMELIFEDDHKMVQEFSFSIENEWNTDHLEFVAFVQNIETKEVSQATFFSANQVSIHEQEKATLTVYPNPATDFIRIKAPESFYAIDIFNSAGLKVASYQLHDGKSSVDIRTLTSGLYFIHGRSNKQSFLKKIMVK